MTALAVDDLAIGAPNKTVSSTGNAGGVWLYRGRQTYAPAAAPSGYLDEGTQPAK